MGKFELVFFKGVNWIAKLDPLFKLIQLTSVAQDMDTFIPGRVKRDPRHRFIAGVIRRLDNHKVVGAIIAVWKLWQEYTAYIPAIWIDRPYRGTKVNGRSLAELLMRTLFKLLRQDNFFGVVLDVLVNNKRAISFYRKLGFRVYMLSMSRRL